MSAPETLAASPKTFLDRGNWMRAVLAADLPDAAVRVALTILRVTTGRCGPSYVTLAAESHVSEGRPRTLCRPFQSSEPCFTRGISRKAATPPLRRAEQALHSRSEGLLGVNNGDVGCLLHEAAVRKCPVFAPFVGG
jgi:hypothetical protein